MKNINSASRLNRIDGRWGMVWRKTFLTGEILEGINYWDRLEFVDRWHCAQWLKGVRRNIRNGKLEWRFSFRPTTARIIPPQLPHKFTMAY